MPPIERWRRRSRQIETFQETLPDRTAERGHRPGMPRVVRPIGFAHVPKSLREMQAPHEVGIEPGRQFVGRFEDVAESYASFGKTHPIAHRSAPEILCGSRPEVVPRATPKKPRKLGSHLEL